MVDAIIKLKVAEAIQDDVNKGIVRIDSGMMQQAGIRPGDIVELEGSRITVAMADRAYPGDIGLNIIRMDGIIRRNAKTGIGEIVQVKKAVFKEAKKVTIAPAKKGIMIRASPEIFKQGLLGRALVKGDIVSLGGTKRRRNSMGDNPMFDQYGFFDIVDESMLGFGFGDWKFIVLDTQPKMSVVITQETEVVFNPEAVEEEEFTTLPETNYEDIGGLDEEIRKIREMVELPLKHPEIFERLGIEPPKGVLLHGPPGTGKTLLAKAVASETNSHFIVINGPEVMSKFYGESEANIRKIFDDAQKNAPSIIFIDEIDAIASKREETKGEVERRVVAQLLSLMDGLKSRGKVVVIAATNVPNILDPALRRPGRFDREIEIGVPTKEGRLNILKIHTRNMPIETSPENFDKNLHLDKLTDIVSKRISSILVVDLLKTAGNVRDKDTREMVKKYVKATFQPVTKQMREDFYEKLTNMLTDEITKQLPYDIKSGTIDTKTEKLISERLNIIKEKSADFIRKVIKELMLEDVAERTYGFVGADLSALAKEAAMCVLRKVLPDIRMRQSEETPIPQETLEKMVIMSEDFKDALKIVRPSALREVLIEIPNVKWGDIGGLDGVKQELIEAVEWPLKYPNAFGRMGVKPPKGILLYGAPGTGKTMLAKAVAAEAKSNFILVKGPELLSKWVGESEKAVREIFKKARQTSPTIIFFDEIDSLVPRRGMGEDSHVVERVVNQMLTEIDGLEEMQDVVIIAATNRPDIMDPALLRPGRFDRIILVPAPDDSARLEIFKVHTKNMPFSLTKDEQKKLETELKNLNSNLLSKLTADENAQEINSASSKNRKIDEVKGFKDLTDTQKILMYLARKTEGYTGADIESICREAAIFALREDILKAKEVNLRHFDMALEKVTPSATKEIVDAYANLQGEFSSAKAKQMMHEKPAYMG